MVIADSDVFIDYMAGVQAVADELELHRRARSLAVSAVTVHQLLSARDKRSRRSAENALAGIRVIAFDAKAARIAATLELDLRHRPIGTADLYIAATCLAVDAALFTRNRREFERVRGLRLT